MFFTPSMVSFLPLLITEVHIISTAGNYDPDIYSDLKDFICLEDELENNCKLSSGESSGIKRQLDAVFIQNKSKKIRTRPMYYSGTKPINPKIDDEMVNILAYWEKKLISEGSDCVWENFNDLKESDVKDLCIDEYKIQILEIPGVILDGAMRPDCSPAYFPGPSQTTRNFYRYTGYFQYAAELKEQQFFPDLVRCNCAYLKSAKKINTYNAADKSKRFFFLFKFSDAVYYVLSTYGALRNRKLKIVNVRLLKADKASAVLS